MADSTKKREAAKSTLTVGAKHCLWFAWAGNLKVTNGPEDEGKAASDTDADYRPQSVPVSSGALVTVSITNAAQRWRHHPSASDESGAHGMDGSNGTTVDSRGLENAAYRSATYHSQNINPLTTHLNKLVAIFGTDNPPSTATNQHIIGTGATLTAPNGATKIFFGFHDGRQWTNNSGAIDIDVTVQTI